MTEQETCRTCLQTNGRCRNIFEDTNRNNKLISELIMECVPITIQREDELPKNICEVCIERLNFVLDFREMAIKSNETLSRCLQNGNCDENKESKEEIKDELEVDEMDTYSITDIGANLNEDHQKHTNIDDEMKDVVECTKTSITFLEGANENIIEELCLNSTDTLEDSNECYRDSSISEAVSEKVIKKVTKKLNYRSYNKEQLEVILNNPDCKRIAESSLSRKEKTDAKIRCQYCNKLYSFRYYVAVHAHTHVGNVPFKCEVCEYRSPVQNLLRKHMQKHSQTKNIFCTQCGRAFASKHVLKAHEVVHSNDMPFKCGTCGKTFKRLLSLQAHGVVHRDVKEFVCDECGKSFTQKIGMLNHKAIHRNERKFECTTCGKKFLLKARLNNHAKQHLGLKRFICDVCGKGFAQKPALQHHIWIHTGEKPFSCDICGKRFRQSSCIPRHMRIHTGETPYPCTICLQRFKYSHHLLSHMQRHENNRNGKGCQNEKVNKKTDKKKNCESPSD